jgi:hypothetical protein
MESTGNILSPQEEEMSQRSRRGFLLSLIVPLTLAPTACSPSSPSQQAAEKFMEAYYVQLNVPGALPLTEGLAKEKLQGQIQLLQGAGGPDPAQDKPQISYKLINHNAEDPHTATFVYEVRTNQKEVGKRMVFVKVRHEAGDRWVITQFTENDASPK